MSPPIEETTTDGYDRQFGTNVLGHFHFTTLLMPAILASSSPRIVHISSDGHQVAPKGGILFDRLKGPKKGTWIPVAAWFERFQWYGQVRIMAPSTSTSPSLNLSSLCRFCLEQTGKSCVIMMRSMHFDLHPSQGNILFSNELARRYKDQGLISISVHPGVIKTDLARSQSAVFLALIRLATKDAVYGATTSLYAATNPEASALNGKVSHSFFSSAEAMCLFPKSRYL